MKTSKPVSNTSFTPDINSEISVTFIQPFTNAKIEGLVSTSLTANDIISALAAESFIPLPIDCNGSPRYVLSVDSGYRMNSSDSFADAGVTDGCVVHVIAVCSDDETENDEQEKEEIESYETTAPAPSSKICVRFSHPTTSAVLEATVSSTITAKEIISALITEHFLDSPAYALRVGNDYLMNETDTLADVGVKEGCKIPIIPVLWVKCIHPIDNSIWRRAYTKEVSSQRIYNALIEDHFLPKSPKYVFSFNGATPVRHEFTASSNHKPYHNLYNDKLALYFVEDKPVPRNSLVPSSEITVKFSHPSTGALLEANVNDMLTLDEIIGALIDERFLCGPAKCLGSQRYALAIHEGSLIQNGTDTLQDLGATENCTISIIQPAVAKPVIYLYPPEPMDIQVSLKNADNLTVSYPEYGDGWNVRAEPDGTLHDLKDGNEYSYLFWESAGDRLYDLKSGFVVRQHELLPFLREKLASFGLTPKEYNEFIVYWYPILKQYEACAINFFCEEYEADYALDITPNPDHLLRVYMLYRAADADEILQEPPAVSAVSREGFTVIEWGGQLLG